MKCLPRYWCSIPKHHRSLAAELQEMKINLNSSKVIVQLEEFLRDPAMDLTFHFIFSRDIYFIFASIVVGMFFYWLLFVPCNWSKSMDDVGYDMMTSKEKLKPKNKKEAINRIRKCRNVGAREIPPPYPNGWYGILESSNLQIGEAKNISCLGEQFVVFRTNESKVHILDAYCPHMGANMGVGGKVVGDSIQCPFHLWSFRGEDGKCSNIPYSSCVPQGVKVKKWISHEVNDFIFVWYHSDPDELPWELPVVKEIQNQEFIYHGRNEFYVNCHIQEIPENGADMAHFAAIHKVSVLAGGSDPKNNILKNAGNHLWDAIWKPAEAPLKHKAVITLKHSIELTSNLRFFNINIKGEQLGPSYVQLHMNSAILGRVEVLQVVIPVEPLLQKVVHRFYAPRFRAPIMKFVVFGESIMFERDMAMWNNKMFRSKLHLVKEDYLIKQFRNWYSQFYSDSSKTYAEAKENLDW